MNIFCLSVTVQKTQPASNNPKSSPLNKGGSLPLAPRPYVNRRQQRKTAQVTKEYLDLQKRTQELLQKQIQQQKVGTVRSLTCKYSAINSLTDRFPYGGCGF